MTRILALVPNERGYAPGQRSTIEIWDPVLRKAGIEVDYAVFETPTLRHVLGQRGHLFRKAAEMIKAYARRVRTMRSVSSYDAVYVYREAALIGPALLERWAAGRGKPLIYSLDDPLYIPYRSPVNGWLSHLKFFGKVANICRLSRVVIANSSFHRLFAAQQNENVWEIPSLVDGDRFRPRPRNPGGGACVGWSGSPSTAPNLSLVADPLRRLTDAAPHRLFFVGAKDVPLQGLSYDSREWREETEVDDLSRIDIGLVPMPDNEWNRRKFNLKVAQYMALGIVPVATPLGENPRVIQHGHDGFLASSPDEWFDALRRLVQDEDLRLSMSERAARKARESFTIQARGAEVVAAFESALS